MFTEESKSNKTSFQHVTVLLNKLMLQIREEKCHAVSK